MGFVKLVRVLSPAPRVTVDQYYESVTFPREAAERAYHVLCARCSMRTKTLRSAFGNAFICGGLLMNLRNVLVSETTVMNEKGYRLKVSVEWSHIDAQ